MALYEHFDRTRNNSGLLAVGASAPYLTLSRNLNDGNQVPSPAELRALEKTIVRRTSWKLIRLRSAPCD